ncbi:MAG TPA: helix-turn-helix domain-containing protein [Thermoplasmata archaeon]|nr:helix-turn-helix domain-containing protein [Thermoplasmata archaeon]
MQIVNLKVTHECPFSRPVAGSAHARVTHLCHRGKEAVLEAHTSEPEVMNRLISEYAQVGGEVLYEEQDRSAALIRFPVCACCRSGKVIPTIEGVGHLYLPPSAYSADGESYQFLAQEQRLESHLLERLPRGVKVVRVGTKPLTSLEFEGGFLVPVGVLFRGLTDRQRQAILTGMLRGYYRIPHAVTTEELARSLGISRPAFDALLRKAENKLAAALFPYLAVQGPGPGDLPLSG